MAFPSLRQYKLINKIMKEQRSINNDLLYITKDLHSLEKNHEKGMDSL